MASPGAHPDGHKGGNRPLDTNPEGPHCACGSPNLIHLVHKHIVNYPDLTVSSASCWGLIPGNLKGGMTGDLHSVGELWIEKSPNGLAKAGPTSFSKGWRGLELRC